MQKRESPEFKLDVALILIIFGVLTCFLLNHLLINFNVQKMVWAYQKIIPVENPFGIDYRDGWYNPAAQLLAGKPAYSVSQYPPFVSLLAIPLAALFSEQTGYFIQVGILCVLTVSSLVLSLRIVHQVFPFRDEREKEKRVSFVLFLAFATYHLSSYGFTFSIERGNYDIYALFFSLLFLDSLTRHPEKVWLQVIWLSIAIHLKLYPAVLILPLLWKQRGRAILPLLAVNIGLLLVLGPAEAAGFVRNITSTIQAPPIAVFNHSTVSFTTLLFEYLAKLGITLPWAGRWLIRLLPLIVFSLEVLWLLPGGYSAEKVVWLFLVSVPLMNLLPSVSFDYKLILLTFPLLMVIYLLIQRWENEAKPLGTALLGLFATGLLFFLDRSYVLMAGLFQNKWIFIVLLQLVLGFALAKFNPNPLQRFRVKNSH